MDREAWRAAIHGVAKSRTWLSDWTELNWTDYSQNNSALTNCQIVLGIPENSQTMFLEALYPLQEKAMATHSNTLAWKIPWTEETVRLQSMGSHRVRHNWATSLSLFTFMHWRRKGQPTPVFLLGESQGRGAWWAAVYGVAQSRTRLKRLSSSSSTHSSILAWRIPWTEEPGSLQSMRSWRVRQNWMNKYTEHT